jgi:hypothetical protein
LQVWKPSDTNQWQMNSLSEQIPGRIVSKIWRKTQSVHTISPPNLRASGSFKLSTQEHSGKDGHGFPKRLVSEAGWCTLAI